MALDSIRNPACIEGKKRMNQKEVSYYFNNIQTKLNSNLARDKQEIKIINLILDNREILENRILNSNNYILSNINIKKIILGKKAKSEDLIYIFIFLYSLSLCEPVNGFKEIRENLVNNIDWLREKDSEILLIESQASLRFCLDTEKKELLTEIENLKKEIDGEQIKINKIKLESNFVGLSKAFHRMLKEKYQEKNILIFSLCILGLLLIAPFAYILYTQPSIVDRTYYIGYIPAIGYELIIFYFFRVVLKNYYSVKAHILQLSLRTSLFSFVESYADFSKSIAEENRPVLSKFEGLIFSDLHNGNIDLPKTVDGIEQIVKLIKK